jgi:hypothetical protein
MAKILITSSKKRFVVYDTENENLYYNDSIEEFTNENLINSGWNKNRLFGIAIENNDIYIASNEKIVIINKETYDFNRVLPIRLYPETHEIAKLNDLLFTCNTSNDTLGIYNLKTKENKFVNVNDMTFIDEPDHIEYDKSSPTNIQKKHINSVYVHNDNVYFNLHNRGIAPSEIYVLHLKNMSIEKVLNVGTCNHSVRIFNDILYCLSSETHELIEYNLKERTLEKYKLKTNKKIYMRGLDYLDGKLIIGGSVNYKVNNTVKFSCLLEFDLITKKFNHLKTIEDVSFILDLKVIR